MLHKHCKSNFMKNISYLRTSFYIVLFISLCSCSKSAKSPLPISSFTDSILNEVPPSVVSFTNSSENATSYLWNFGDSTISTVMNPTHIYKTNGNYTATLTSTGPGGVAKYQNLISIGAKTIIITGIVIDSIVQTASSMFFSVYITSDAKGYQTSPYQIPGSASQIYPDGSWSGLNYNFPVSSALTLMVTYALPGISQYNIAENSTFNFSPATFTTGSNAYPQTLKLVNYSGTAVTHITLTITWK